MMPDLGRYAGTVLGAYGATIALLAALVAVSLWRSARVRRALERAEAEIRGRSRG
ncbi:heme exporter protein CcmD [Rhodobacteraceae bacterium DSL-40]|uniref:heme exporter protein CcmD n=1 Tax=Amaricoccus sp. B4 TaxID=3368557 RepID=UPI000DAC7A41